MPQMVKYLRAVLEDHDLPTGSSLEDRVTWRLHCLGVLDKWQYRVGKYRLDYAWPDHLIALEADGPMHRTQEVAARDVYRDAYLREHGWLVFRVDEMSGTLDEQVMRVVAVLRQFADDEDRDYWKARTQLFRQFRQRCEAAAAGTPPRR